MPMAAWERLAGASMLIGILACSTPYGLSVVILAGGMFSHVGILATAVIDGASVSTGSFPVSPRAGVVLSAPRPRRAGARFHFPSSG